MTDNNTVDERPVVLKVDHVAKSFRLPTEQATGLKMAFLNWTKGIKGYTEQHVLRDINFEVHQGDFFGIVGRNGSGKSTLLKIISQIYVPEQGSVMVKGKLVPFIELGVGFNPELTGRENVYLNGALLGFTHEEIDAMYDDIVEFAELEDFMDQKLKNYSSGMQVRLAFSVAIKAQGDILVLDEVLAVGDEAFQRKCDNFFAEIKKDPTKTVILVTHSMDAVKKYCNKAILIKDGEIVASGDKNDVADRYTLENLKVERRNAEKEKNEEEEGLITVLLQSIHGMSDKNDRFSWVFLDFSKEVVAFALERLVSNSEHFVKHQNVALGFNRYGESKTHLHAGRIVLKLLIHEVFKLSELYDVVIHRIDFSTSEAQQSTVQIHVLASGQLRVEAHTEFDERDQFALDGDRSVLRSINLRCMTTS